MASLSDFHFKCTKCGLCCSHHGLIVNLTPRDLKILAKHFKAEPKQLLKIIGFYQVREDDNDSGNIEERLVFPPLKTNRGMAYMGLLKRSDGRCIFLKDEKCRIYSARPRLCQSFPFTFSRKSQGASISITNFATRLCPGIGEGNAVNVEKVKKLGKKVLRDIESFFSFANWWNNNHINEINSEDELKPEEILKALLDYRE